MRTYSKAKLKLKSYFNDEPKSRVPLWKSVALNRANEKTLYDVLLLEENFGDSTHLNDYIRNVLTDRKSCSDIKVVYYMRLDELNLVDSKENLKDDSYLIIGSLRDEIIHQFLRSKVKLYYNLDILERVIEDAYKAILNRKIRLNPH